jgi:hypothetical protein
MVEDAAGAARAVPEASDAFVAQVAAAWAEGAQGWERLAAAWGAAASSDEPPAAARCWWDGAPWYGEIADAEFRAIVAAYVARYGAYTPDLPEREPGLLEAWRAGQAAPAAA